MQDGSSSSPQHGARYLPDGPAAAPHLLGCDWAASTLGPPAGWPGPLRNAASLVLDSAVPMWLAWGPDLAMLYNEPYAAMLGRKHPQALGAPLRQVWHETWPDVEALVSAALAGRALHREDVALLVDRQGQDEQAWFSFTCTPLRDDEGSVRGLVCTLWETTRKMHSQRELGEALARLDAAGDVTERKLAEQALRESERQFKTLFDSIDEGFCIIEFLDGPHGPMSDYVHVLANPAYLANAGIADVVGQRVRDMVPAEADGWVEIYRRVLLTGEPVRFERELVRTGRVLGLSAFRVEPPERRQVAVLFLDVTQRHRAEVGLRELNETLERRVSDEVAERLKTEEALRQSQKMEAVGQLTGGIAHDFNNMLAVVLGSLDLLARRYVAEDSPARRHVDAARDGVKRATQLTQRLLAFSRQQPLKPEPVDANKLVASMSELLRHSLGGAIRLETVLAGGLWRAHADPHQLENVILNLAINGRDAMADGGRLTIETANCHLDDHYAAAHVGVLAGQYVMVAVSDIGTGMSADTASRAFDPFFTTKAVGRGTGLGLSQVYGFVKQSGGHVKIYSELGEGTVVKVYLPRLAAAQAAPVEVQAAPGAMQGANDALVLVVEDEPAVRQFSVDALTELGYRVLEADGARAALKLLDAHPEIDLMFTDVVMPEVNGRKLADEALRRRPSLKILFTTGYTRNAVVHNGVLDQGVYLIGKPFSIEELALRVREVLDAPDRSHDPGA